MSQSSDALFIHIMKSSMNFQPLSLLTKSINGYDELVY